MVRINQAAERAGWAGPRRGGLVGNGDQVDDVLHEALGPVMRDLDALGSSVRPVKLEERDWTDNPDRPSAMIRSTDGTAQGVAVDRSAPLPSALPRRLTRSRSG